MSSTTIQLPSGTNMKKCINLPKAGGWLGGVNVSLSVTGADASIQQWLLVYPDPANNGNKWYRRVPPTGGPYTTNYENWTLSQDTRAWNGTFAGECLNIVWYTSTNDISLCIETTRSYSPPNHPRITGTDIYPEHGHFYYGSTPPAL